MNASDLFKLYNMAVIPAWVLLWFFPRKRITQILVTSGLFSLLIALSYIVFLITSINMQSQPPSFASINDVMKLLSNDWGMLAGWTHYLCFDLLVGSWILRDSQKHQLAHVPVAFCLFFTLMLGPVGFALYWIMRTTKRKQWNADLFN